MAQFGPIDNAIKNADRLLTQALLKAKANIERILAAHGQDGLYKKELLQLLDELGYFKDLERILSTNGYNVISKEIAVTIEKEALEVLKAYGQPAKNLTGLGDEQLRQIIDQQKTQALAYPEIAIEAQKKAILGLSTGLYSQTQAANILTGSLGVTFRKSLTTISQNMSATSRYLNVTLGTNLGYTLFEYVGASPDSVMRDWCYMALQRGSKGQPPGIYTLADFNALPPTPNIVNPMADRDKVQKYPGPFPYNPSVHGGGWECRHTLAGVS